MLRCKLCVDPVLCSKNRRQLASLSSKNCRAVLTDLACECGQSKRNVAKDYGEGYVCKKCFNAIAKYSALQEEVQNRKRELLSKLSRHVGSSATHETQGTKRSADTVPHAAHAVKVVVTYQDYEKKYNLSPTREPIGKCLGRNAKRAFAKHSLESPALLEHFLLRINKIIRKEMSQVLRDTAYNIKKAQRETMTALSWANEYRTLRQKAPVLVRFLDACIPKESSRRQCTIMTCIGVLAKSHCRNTLLHAFISLVLSYGHAGKLVYSRLQKLGLCLSDSSTRALLDILGTDHDKVVKNWVSELSLPTNQGIMSFAPATLFDSEDTSNSTSSLSTVFNEQSQSNSFRASTPVSLVPSSPPPPPQLASSSSSSSSFCDSTSPVGSGDFSLVTAESSPSCDTHTSTSDEDTAPLAAAEQNSPQDGSPVLDCGEWNGFKLIGDNIDKNIKPRDMRINNQTKSLHYFHAFAVKDRINFSDITNNAELVFPDDIDYSVFYPNDDDDAQLVSNFQTLVTRIFVEYIPHLQHLLGKVTHNIQHKYSKNMSIKSTVVPLGVILKNENILNDMVDILDVLHQYVPKTTTTQTYNTCAEDGAREQLSFAQKGSGGNLVTGCTHQAKSGTKVALACLGCDQTCHYHDVVMVVWKRLYNTSSGVDKGTLFQLRNLINRRNVVSDVSKDTAACEEFMELITVAHILSAAVHITGVPDLEGLSKKILSSENHFAAVSSIAKTLCSDVVTLSFAAKPSTGSADCVMEYAKETLSLGLLLLEFNDAIREGDGDKNYCIEAFHLLMQYYYTLTPRCAEQMLWGRFVNSVGGPGHNISGDLHMEHLNRILKDTVSHLGANKTPKSIVRAAKALGPLKDILAEFDKKTGVWFKSKHCRRSEKEDLLKIVAELNQNEVFHYQPGRKHLLFPSMKCNGMLMCIDRPKLTSWISVKAENILRQTPFTH
ncbi:hypothetical protein EMCRGX_G022803 [Ephydatia muelleri]